jgi:hypothetical protein
MSATLIEALRVSPPFPNFWLFQQWDPGTMQPLNSGCGTNNYNAGDPALSLRSGDGVAAS